MRALLLLIAGFIVFGITVATTVYLVTVNQLKKTEPYRLAVERVAQHPAVQAQLGRPIEPTFAAAGQVNQDTGYAELTLRIAGPTGKGTVRAIAEHDPHGKSWELVFLDVATFSDFGVQVVEIINEKPPTGPDLPEPTEEAKKRYGVE